LWKLVWDAVGFSGGEQPDDWIRRMLKSPAIREYLAFVGVLLAILWAGTSSIYLTFAGETRGQSQFTVEVWEGDRMLIPPVELSSYDRDRGRPFFFRLRSTTLEYRIVAPSGYQPLTLTFAPWSQHRLKVPGDFRPKELHLLRIFPGFELASQLPNEPDAPGATYALTIATGADSITIHPLTKRVILAGMGATELRAAVTPAELAATRAAVDSYYAAQGFSAADRESTVARIVDGAVQQPTPEWSGGRTLKLTVVRRAAGAAADAPGTVVLETEYSIPKDAARVHDVVLTRE
jgi:hypothetical protein